MWLEGSLSSVPIDAELDSKDELDGLESGAELQLSAVVGEGRTWRSKVIVSVFKIDKNVVSSFKKDICISIIYNEIVSKHTHFECIQKFTLLNNRK